MVELAKILGILVMEPGRQSEMQFPTCLWLFRLAWAWAPVGGWAAAAMEYNITAQHRNPSRKDKFNILQYSHSTVQYCRPSRTCCISLIDTFTVLYPHENIADQVSKPCFNSD